MPFKFLATFFPLGFFCCFPWVGMKLPCWNDRALVCEQQGTMNYSGVTTENGSALPDVDLSDEVEGEPVSCL